jgi:hypothetical protein
MKEVKITSRQEIKEWLDRGKRNPNKWMKAPWVVLEAASGKDAWNKFVAFDRGVLAPGRWVRCLDEDHMEVPYKGDDIVPYKLEISE